MKGVLLRACAALTLAVMACAGLAALGLSLGSAEIDRAIGIGRKNASERRQFHSAYTIPIDDPTLAGFEVLTEFRRVVLESEERERLGNRHLDVIDAEAVLRPFRDKVAIQANLRFNPHNVLVSVPSYDIILAGDRGEEDLMPVNMRRIPFMNGTVIVTAIVEGLFDAKTLARSRRTIVLRDDHGQQLAAASFNFAIVE